MLAAAGWNCFLGRCLLIAGDLIRASVIASNPLYLAQTAGPAIRHKIASCASIYHPDWLLSLLFYWIYFDVILI